MNNRLSRKLVVFIMFFMFFGVSIGTSFVSNIEQYNVEIEMQNLPVLPRWREGGTPYNEEQSLYPYMIKSRDVPTSGIIESPPEYDPVRGVLFWYNFGHWTEVVIDCVVELTQDSEYDEIAYVVVTSESQKSNAISEFSSGGANLDKVEFIIEPGNSIWLRDYGPHFIYQDDAIGIVDSHYYPNRYLDNFIPTLIGDNHFIMPTYDMGLYYSGGNFQPGPDNTGFVTSLVTNDNPISQGFDEEFIAELYHTYQGIEELHILPQLPGNVDGTGHIDMWMYLIDEDTVIISEFKPGSNQQAIQITNNAVDYMENLGFEVYRTPAWNANHPDNGYPTHWTYTNSFRVNDRIFIPTFGETYTDYADEDVQAYNAFSAAVGSGVEIVQINCYPIIWAAGAIHCIVMQVPRATKSHPVAHVIYPDGGELFTSGTTQTIQWVATDTDNNVIPQIDLYYSIDGGSSYEYIDTTTDTGFYDWEVPDIDTEEAKIKIVAISEDNDEYEAESDNVFEISFAFQTIYDFSVDPGINKYCRGHQTNSWSEIDGDRTPVNDQIDSEDYSKIAYSDATGGDGDSNRYRSPYHPGYSTHIFEFNIDEESEDIGDIEFLWEGYADSCTQAELYVWDYTEGQWGDGEGLYNLNRYMDCWAGNVDGYLKYNIRNNFDRYIGNNGQMTFLIHTDRTSSMTFHDYARLTITSPLQTAELKIDTIHGGLFKVNTAIKNVGYFNATNVNWTINLNGGLIIIGKQSSGVIPKIQSNEIVEISSKPIIGFGKAIVEVTADLDIGIPDTREQDATVLLFLINVKPGG
jgi:agmatine/peptidylarginine deiminase